MCVEAGGHHLGQDRDQRRGIEGYQVDSAEGWQVVGGLVKEGQVVKGT